MAINTTTFESTLQTKLDDTTLAAKDMLLLGKALEATSGNIAVSNVTAEGTTQVARVVAAMTGALPAQSGQAGKVLTSDGTDSSWQEGLPSQTGQSAKFLTTDGTSANWQALSSSALSSDFVVEVGKTVSTGDVVNYVAGKIGENPVVNTQATFSVDTTYDYHAMNSAGTVVVRAEANSSGHHQARSGVLQTNGSIVWNSETTIYTGHTSSGTSIKHLGGDRFVIYGTKNGYTTSCSTTDVGYAYFAFFSVNPITGGISYSSTRTYSQTGYHQCNPSLAFYKLAGDKIGYFVDMWHYRSGCASPGSSFHGRGSLTFTDSGTISTHDNSEDYHLNFHDDTVNLKFAAGSKLLRPHNANAYLASWNGTNVSSPSEIPFDASYSADLRLYRPDENVDKFIAGFRNASNQFVISTYSYLNGAITKDSTTVVVDDGAGVSVGRFAGEGDNMVVGYEDNSKGYVASFTLDPTTKIINGTGLSVQHNSSNQPVQVYGPHDTNKYGMVANASSVIISNELTVNAYSAAALNWLGIANSNGAAGDSVNVTLDGIASGFTGLTAGVTYYYDTALYDGSITTTITNYLIGTAVSSTEINLNA